MSAVLKIEVCPPVTAPCGLFTISTLLSIRARGWVSSDLTVMARPRSLRHRRTYRLATGIYPLNGKQIGRTRSQGPGRYTHQIVRQGLAIMPQGDEIFQGLTVEEHLDSGAFTPEAWRTRKERKERVLGIFEPLRKLMKTPVGRLSGGERRMVSIGRGLMTDAKLYLSDEPSLGLAPKLGIAVMEALLAIDLKDSAMFIAEQNVALLEGKVDRIIGMHAGKLKGEASSSFRLSGSR